MKNQKTLISAFVALFAAIICVGCFIKIPLGVIPVVLQNVLCILSGVLLGGILGGVPTALFLLAGLIGLPVYSGGSSGVAVWLGPTGGFLPGYFIGALVAGLIAGKPSVNEIKRIDGKIYVELKSFIRVIFAIISGMIILYIPGVFIFASWAQNAGKVPVDKTAFAYTLGACVIPFIPGDVLKIVFAIPVAFVLRPVVAQYLYANSIGGTGAKTKN